MNIRDAYIDWKTGNIVVTGRIAISPGASSLPSFPKHDLIMLDFSSAGFKCHPVLEITPLPNGFCKTIVSEPSIFCRALTPELFAHFPGGRDELRLHRVESGLGSLHGKSGAAFTITEIDVMAKLQSDGMRFETSGRLGQWVSDWRSGEVPPPDSSFTISGTVPWATMILGGVGPGGRYHQFIPRTGWTWTEQEAVAFDSLDPSGLIDLRSTRGFNEPLVPGRLIFTGPNGRTIIAAQRILSAGFSPYRLSFSDSDRARLRPDGLCDAMRSKVYVSTKFLNRRVIESALDGRTRMSLMLDGDCLGHVSYETPYRNGHGDALGSIKQQFSRLQFDAELMHDRLSLRLFATLRPFDPDVFARHQRERNSTLVPYESVTLTASLPGALFRLLKSPLADQQTRLAAE